MSYTKHTWVDGEVITAAKLNNIEEGIEGAQDYMPAPSAFIVNAVLIDTEDDYYTRLDKTWREIYNAFLTGPVWIVQSSTESLQEYDENDQPFTMTDSSYNVDIVDCVLSEQESAEQGVWYYLVTISDNYYGTYSENDYPSSGSSGLD